jgi:uncharacterized protein YndB with AHSA1/START domain
VAAPADSWVLDVTCTLSAAPERVFGLLTEPSELGRWWGPQGFTTPEIESDLRVGGNYRLGMQPPDGALFHLSGTFVEVDRPRRLAYTFRWDEPDPDDRETLVEFTLEPLAREPLPDGTRITLRQAAFATEARLALHRTGWTDAFDKLREVVAASGDR